MKLVRGDDQKHVNVAVAKGAFDLIDDAFLAPGVWYDPQHHGELASGSLFLVGHVVLLVTVAFFHDDGQRLRVQIHFYEPPVAVFAAEGFRIQIRPEGNGFAVLLERPPAIRFDVQTADGEGRFGFTNFGDLNVAFGHGNGVTEIGRRGFRGAFSFPLLIRTQVEQTMPRLCQIPHERLRSVVAEVISPVKMIDHAVAFEPVEGGERGGLGCLKRGVAFGKEHTPQLIGFEEAETTERLE